MNDERLTTDAAIKHLESIIYEDFAPYTQKCLLKVIEAARQAKSIECSLKQLRKASDEYDKLMHLDGTCGLIRREDGTLEQIVEQEYLKCDSKNAGGKQ